MALIEDNMVVIMVVIYLLRISVEGRISPSQFHTDTAGALLQHRPHTKGFAVFCSFVPSPPVPLSARCCWDPFLLTVSTSPSSSSIPALTSSISLYASSSSSLPRGTENRTAFTRWTSTNGRSNWGKWQRSGQAVLNLLFHLFLMWKFPYLVLCACVPVEELEESQRVSVPYQDEVPCPVRQVSRGREAQRTLGTRAGHTSERHTPEPALHTHPLAWRDREK